MQSIFVILWRVLVRLAVEKKLSLNGRGLAIHAISPSVIDLWHSIGSVSRFLMFFAITTMVLLPGLWLTLFAIRMIKDSSGEKSDLVRWAKYLEPIVRPWVLCHIWSASLCLAFGTKQDSEEQWEERVREDGVPVGPERRLEDGAAPMKNYSPRRAG
eukprot:s490_g6.t1